MREEAPSVGLRRRRARTASTQRGQRHCALARRIDKQRQASETYGVRPLARKDITSFSLRELCVSSVSLWLGGGKSPALPQPRYHERIDRGYLVGVGVAAAVGGEADPGGHAFFDFDALPWLRLAGVGIERRDFD